MFSLRMFYLRSASQMDRPSDYISLNATQRDIRRNSRPVMVAIHAAGNCLFNMGGKCIGKWWEVREVVLMCKLSGPNRKGSGHST
jgi:hypothetical protein